MTEVKVLNILIELDHDLWIKHMISYQLDLEL